MALLSLHLVCQSSFGGVRELPHLPQIDEKA